MRTRRLAWSGLVLLFVGGGFLATRWLFSEEPRRTTRGTAVAATSPPPRTWEAPLHRVAERLRGIYGPELAACGATSPAAEEPARPGTLSGKVSVAYRIAGVTGEVSDAMTEDFRKRNPSVQVEKVAVDGSLTPKIVELFAAGKPHIALMTIGPAAALDELANSRCFAAPAINMPSGKLTA